MRFNTKTYQLQVGNLNFQIESNVSLIDKYLNKHYRSCLSTSPPSGFIDYYISVMHGSFYRRLFRPQVEFSCNYLSPFNSFPLEQAQALLEWGLNWVIATQAHQYFIIHAASLEKNGKGVIIAAPSGSGKSTLSAYLVSKGWRLLSDEHALIDRQTLQMHGLARPINLKNQSIDLIKPFFPADDFSSIALDTHKGQVSLLKPPNSSIEKASLCASPNLLVFVNYNPNESFFVKQLDKAEALIEIIRNSFNFGLLHTEGFKCARALTEKCDAIFVEYSEFEACEQALLHHLDKEYNFEKVS